MHSAEDRILHLLKSRGPATTDAIARHLRVTVVGARKHLSELRRRDLVHDKPEAGRVGRPRSIWSLTEAANARFPDSHSHLTVELIGAARAVFGEKGLERLISLRETDALKRYEARLEGMTSVADRVSALCAARTEEGYMAECQPLPDGTLLLVENHCPICAAARECQGFCRSELALFRRVLGPDTRVERTDHALAGARRCAYRISPA